MKEVVRERISEAKSDSVGQLQFRQRSDSIDIMECRRGSR